MKLQQQALGRRREKTRRVRRWNSKVERCQVETEFQHIYIFLVSLCYACVFHRVSRARQPFKNVMMVCKWIFGNSFKSVSFDLSRKKRLAVTTTTCDVTQNGRDEMNFTTVTPIINTIFWISDRPVFESKQTHTRLTIQSAQFPFISFLQLVFLLLDFK